MKRASATERLQMDTYMHPHLHNIDIYFRRERRGDKGYVYMQ